MKRNVLIAAGVAALVLAIVLVSGIVGSGPAGPGDGESGRESVGPGDGKTGPPTELPDDIRTILMGGRAHPGFQAVMEGADRLDAAAADALLAIIADVDARDDIRDFALLPLTRHPREDIGEKLVAFLRTTDASFPEHLRWRILETLRERHDVEQVPALLEIMLTPGIPAESIWMMSEAVRWLEAPAPLAELRGIMNEDDPMRRAGAAKGLLYAHGGSVPPEVDRMLRQDAEVMHEVVRAIFETRDPAGRRYLAGLAGDADVSEELRILAVNHIGEFEDEQTADRLLDIIAKGTAPVSVLAAVPEALGRTRASGVADRVRSALLVGSRIDVRIAAAEALRRTGDREGLGDVRNALTGPPEAPAALRSALAGALGELGGSVDRGLLESVRDEDSDPTVRDAAARALERLDEILLSDPNR